MDTKVTVVGTNSQVEKRFKAIKHGDFFIRLGLLCIKIADSAYICIEDVSTVGEIHPDQTVNIPRQVNIEFEL